MEALDMSTQNKEAGVKKHRRKNEEEEAIEGGREMDEQQSIGGAQATKR